MTTVFHARQCGRFIELQSSLRKKKLHRANQGFNFPRGSSSSNIDNVGAPISLEEKENSIILKHEWTHSLKNGSIHFHINNISVIRLVRQNKLSFFQHWNQLRFRFKFSNQFKLLPQKRCLITLSIESITNIDSSITITSTGRSLID